MKNNSRFCFLFDVYFSPKVENVMDDVDLRVPYSREEFEDLCKDLLAERITKPIDDALKSSGYTLGEIDQVE